MTLIHKVDSPLELGNFRPIYLMKSLYKLVAKLLVVRLVIVMGKIISPTQLTYLKGRKLVDKVMVLSEVIDLAKSLKQKFLILKVDF